MQPSALFPKMSYPCGAGGGVGRLVRVDCLHAEPGRGRPALGHRVYADDPFDAEVPGDPYRELTDGPEAENGQHAALGRVGIGNRLVGRGQHVGQEQVLLVWAVRRDLDRAELGLRHAEELCLPARDRTVQRGVAEQRCPLALPADLGGLALRVQSPAGEVAVITGASRGLGLLLARELARHSCPLVICARDRAELERAAGQLRGAGAEVTAVACDLTDEASAQLLIDTTLERYGRLDILISNAGIIQVGPVQAAEPAHYETALNTMALAPVRLTLAALPVMRNQGHGRIVTIASIGGKLSVPHLLPYSTAKFAAVGFSEGLRAELGHGPVTVTTVVPGLMRTGSHLQARFTGQAGKEFTWFALGASLPLLSMDAERAARQIIEAVRRRRPEIILTPAGQLVSRLAGLEPGLTSGVLHLAQRLALPAPPGHGGTFRAEGRDDATPGRELNPALPKKAFDRLTALGQAAASRFNERR